MIFCKKLQASKVRLQVPSKTPIRKSSKTRARPESLNPAAVTFFRFSPSSLDDLHQPQ
jgi:hypothetical protein